MTATTARMLWTGLMVALTLPLLLVLWGFSVDDAWIVSRVVENGLESGVFSFNRGTARTDAVTALGFAELLAGLCRILGTADAFSVARVLGALCTVLSLGVAAWTALEPRADVQEPDSRWRRLAMWVATAALCPSWAAWAGAGLETPLVGSLCTLGCAVWERDALAPAGGRGRVVGPLLLGAAVTFRPELIGFSAVAAITLGTGRSRRALLPLLLVVLPPLGLAALRWSWFGSPLPLGVVAKQPDLLSGLRYLVGSLVLCGPLWLLWALLLEPARAARLWLPAFFAHGLCLALAGGDWMPLYRLWVPVLPWLVAVGVREIRRPRAALGSALAAAAFSGILLYAFGASSRQVIVRREHMVEELRPLLRDSERVAAVDVGWVGRATAARVIDLAGVTDPRVAELPGGHTSKLLHPGFFAARSVDSWLIRAADRSYVPGAPLATISCVYQVDARLLRRASDLDFRGVATISVPGTSEQYVVLRHAQAAE